jgi:hypothetical protein
MQGGAELSKRSGLVIGRQILLIEAPLAPCANRAINGTSKKSQCVSNICAGA